MSSLNVFAISLIFISILSGVLSDCRSCCEYYTGCSTAYNHGSGFCCGSGAYQYCCPSGYVCDGYPYCRYSSGGTTSGIVVGIIIGCIIVAIILVAICRAVCGSGQRGTVYGITTPTYRNYDTYGRGECPPPPPATSSPPPSVPTYGAGYLR